MVDAIIQARMGSIRFPGKVLEIIEGKPLLFYVVERLKKTKSVGDIILAIPDSAENDALLKFAEENKIKCFRGSEEDVLSRFYFAAKENGSKDILRMCADRPLIDPKLIDFVAEKYFKSQVDYISTRINHTFPEGFTVEIFKFSALEEAFKNAKEPNHREHVTPYIYANAKNFKIASVESKEDFSFMRLTVDEEKDVKFLKEVLKSKSNLNFKELANFLKNHPEITKINSSINQVRLKEQENKIFNHKYIYVA